MNTYPWKCCRTCLSDQTLNPIFPISEHNEKYSNIIFTITGLKIDQNDALPQEMCSTCINFINETVKFRKTCEESHKTLQIRLNDKQFYDIKLESQPIFKFENTTAIDISDLIEDDDFKDYDDNITLDSLHYDTNFVSVDKLDNETNGQTDNVAHIDFEKVENLVEEPTEISFKSKKRKSDDVKETPKRKTRVKKENKEVKKKEKEKGSKEQIECEYCHKILTSKTSLRNHYKIHTGFDVVCEHCGKKFITKRLLLMHCRAKHGYEKTDKCSYCEYRASNAEQVKIHERLHTGEKPYACQECGASFHRKSSYLQHVAIHLPEKTVQCAQCPARFKSATLMRIHASRHRAPAYSFRCRVCAAPFARRRNAARHLQRRHRLAPPLDAHILRHKLP